MRLYFSEFNSRRCRIRDEKLMEKKITKKLRNLIQGRYTVKFSRLKKGDLQNIESGRNCLGRV